MMDVKAKKTSGYAKLESKFVQGLLRHPLMALAMHWTFQSLFYMDPTERWFKLMLDAILLVLGGLILSFWLAWPVAWLVAFIIAHTLNFLFNGHLWGVLKHYSLVKYSYESFQGYVRNLGERAQHEPAIDYVVIYGSLSRQKWSPSSDLDARVMRYPGLMNGLRTSWFLLCERSRACIAGFPLDIYLLDHETALKKLNPEETPIYLCRTNYAGK
ncbi:MAG: hypothetical protein KJ077_00145 [Anaerolineae bacterium]|nr:hypothetical protein [Anaerolineae bacterium]